MIVDANIVLRWVVPERRSPAAERLIGAPNLKAPSILLLEIGHALTKRVRRRLASPAQARIAWGDAQAAPVKLIDWLAQRSAALELSLNLHANFYDCLYLALAIAEDDVLVTADARFGATVRTQTELEQRVTVLGEA